MFATRFFHIARGATHPCTFTTATRLRSPILLRQATTHAVTSSVRGQKLSWQSANRHVQIRNYAAFNYRRFQQSSGLFRRWASSPTFYYQVGGIAVLCGAYYTYNLEVVPVSGRRRFNVVSSEYEKQGGEAAYQQTMQEYRGKILPEYTKEHQMVQRVLQRLIPHSGLANESWEVHVIDDEMKNAFVVPGGKVFVFRGILDICQGDDGLAAVLAHEISHNVAHHAAERMSEMFILAPIGLIISFLGGIDYRLIDTVTSLALSLPHSRRQEEEADYIGLLMMAEACYNPEAAMGLWARMEKEEQGSPPQFLSTHPTSHNRLGKIRDWLPQAEAKSEQNDCHITAGYERDFRNAFQNQNQRW